MSATAHAERPKRWYIVHAFSNFEKKVADDIKNGAALRGLGITRKQFCGFGHLGTCLLGHSNADKESASRLTERQLEELGLDDKARTETEKRAAIAAIRANGYVLGRRLEKLQRLGLG
jgi:hypothetical protein